MQLKSGEKILSNSSSKGTALITGEWKKKLMSTNNSKKLAGKVALVTGGYRGIGAAIVKRLAADGADLNPIGRFLNEHYI